MSFSIKVFCLDCHGKIICKPENVEENMVFIVPLKTRYVLEMTQNTILSPLIFKKSKNYSKNKIKIVPFHKFLKVTYIIKSLSILFLIFFALSLFSENIKINLGQSYEYDLKSPPKSIEITNTEVIDVSRVGLSNKINIVAKKRGKSKILINYSLQNQSTVNILVQGLFSSKGGHDAHLASIKSKVNALRGIKAKVSDNKILVLGEFLSLEDFRAYCKLTFMKKGSMVPNYTFKKSIELAVLSSINSDMRAFGEKNVRVFLNNEVFILTGLFSSESSKKTIISYLDSLLPNYVDSTKVFIFGSPQVIQINLYFYEVGKSENSPEGVESSLNELGASVDFHTGVQSGALNPRFHIKSLNIILDALKQNSYTKQIAQPVILTQIEKETKFLAG